METLQVRSNTTGEVRDFPTTRAGVYNMLNFMVENRAYEKWYYDRAMKKLLKELGSQIAEIGDNGIITVKIPKIILYAILAKSVVNNIAGIRGINHLALEVAEKVRDKLYVIVLTTYGIDVSDYGYEINANDFSNVVYSFGKRRLQSDLFAVHSPSGYTNYYPRFMKKYLRYSEEYGEYFFDQLLFEDELSIEDIMRIENGLIGYDGMCHAELENGEEYKQCDYCGLWEYWHDLHEVENTEMYVCDRYMDYEGSFYYCEQCGALIDTNDDSDHVWTDDNYFFCCERCAERAGYHWSDSRETWTEEYDEEDEEDEEPWAVLDYHSHNFYPIGSFTRKNQKHPLYIGRETEVDGKNRREFSSDFFSNLSKLLETYGGEKTCVFERDGSLDSGFEIITQPMTENEFFGMDWSKAFEMLTDNGWRSHDTNTCGTHFHFSSWYLGYNDNQKRDSARKIAHFFNRYWNDLVKFSRRTDTHYCTRIPFEVNSKTDWDDLTSSRYYAVNMTNLGSRKRDTIEIRICRGTLNTDTMLASADFFLHVVRNAKKVPWKDIDNLDLWFKGIKRENTINYIKSRNCFEGAF